ncbi:adaptor protein MecA [Aureibacillus halotolerans]|uniref:Adapter protein MecA n=1 Tax=Aureibacillus halotolerans TaxID=1508390 RepID=A0A4R6UBK7_9BACI|nr:adaptor protein MecA [Aureibacillus halotolerans]TDQ42135.1 adapter protein MecA 1/2 [Aureibacillus halotolerans]
MEIERINEHTVKFFVSYVDIEDRGFEREEIWYSRERSEELFWDMMDEVYHKEKFSMEGPLWIQVQAMEAGLEVIVTKAQFSKDGEKLELPLNDDNHIDIPVDDAMSEMVDTPTSSTSTEAKDEDTLDFVIRFNDLEDAIQLSHRFQFPTLHNELYSYDNNYYLYVMFNDDDEEEVQDNSLSLLLEYGTDSRVSVHRLQEYGNRLFTENALNQLKTYFQ